MSKPKLVAIPHVCVLLYQTLSSHAGGIEASHHTVVVG